MNYVPFAEKVIEMVTDLYKATASHQAVIREHVLQNIIKVSSILMFELSSCWICAG